MTGAELLALASGLLLGLGASLHCAGMCGGIASSLMFMLDPKAGASGRARVLFLAQAGRVSAYVAAGAAVGLFGTALYGALDQATAFRILQWASAATLVWIGASIAGLAPALAGLDRLAVPVVRRLTVAMPGGAHRGGAIASGLVWGFLPCPMVYGALFNAMLTGSASGGALAMAGFGLGTLPAVTAVALGLSRLKEIARGERARLAVGIAIAATGMLALVLSLPGGPLCVTR
jgi:uncharacterized protein